MTCCPLLPAELSIAGLAWSVLGTAAATEWSCAKPVEIEHGHVEHLVRYHCDPYYWLRSSGDGTYKCDESQVWVSPEAVKHVPVCEPVCGKPKNHPPRQIQGITGGMLAQKGSFPWQGWMVTRHNLTVRATLISDQWLLNTSRNVYLNIHSENATLEEIAPTLQLFLGSREQPNLGIERIVLHPSYPQAVDLALLKLKVLLGEEVKRICLAQNGYVHPGQVGYISGWGCSATFGFPDRLKYVMLLVAETEQCWEYYSAQNVSYWVQPILGNDTFCMSELREDTCYGDAGGAFAVQDPDDDTWYAGGIVSYDKICTAAKYGVDVKHVLAWVKETVAAG
ncbi:haptoglobin-like [Cyanocitta cristata]